MRCPPCARALPGSRHPALRLDRASLPPCCVRIGIAGRSPATPRSGCLRPTTALPRSMPAIARPRHAPDRMRKRTTGAAPYRDDQSRAGGASLPQREHDQDPMRSLFSKLDVRNRVQTVALARAGFLGERHSSRSDTDGEPPPPTLRRQTAFGCGRLFQARLGRRTKSARYIRTRCALSERCARRIITTSLGNVA
jgi:hypothetical protein